MHQMLQGFIRDTVSKDSKIKLDETKPLYIIEFGAGPGKFTFHLLHVSDHIILLSHDIITTTCK